MKATLVKKRVCWWLAALLIATTLISIVFLLPYEKEYKITAQSLGFTGTYQLNDGSPPQPLADTTSINACEYTFVTLEGTFNRTLKKDTQIFFYMEYMEVHIYLGGKEIYTWGTAESHPSFMRSSGASWGDFVLPFNISENDEIKITLESKYTNNYTSAYHRFLGSLHTGDSGALAQGVIARHWPHLLTGLLLFVTGLTLQLFILTLAPQGMAIHPSTYYYTLFILVASLWVVINPIYSTLIFGNSTLVMFLETIFLWLFSTFLFGYFGTFMQTRAKKANNILLFCFVSALVLFLILQLFGITDAYAIRDFHNILLCVSAFSFLFIFCYEVRHAKKTELLTMALPGLLYVILGLIEMLNYTFEWLLRGTALTVGFVIFIITQFVFVIRQIGDSLLLALKAASLEKALVESQTSVMLSQIQPHFLYNALTGIKALCGSNPEKAEEAMEHFSFFLRNNLDSLVNTQLIPFDREISHVKDYFYLEKMRFADRVNLVLELEFREFSLPPLTLQPLVENAVHYGIIKKDSGGTVVIRSKKQNGQALIFITDNGVGVDMDMPLAAGRSHTGIENARNRLKMQCGGCLEIKSEKGVGTTVQITIPLEEVFL